MRALIVIRLSKTTEATTSPERQLEVCQNFCEGRGWEVVDTADDLNVSAGKVSPFDRPKLKPWLTERYHEFDVIVVWRIDRLIRSTIDMGKMIEWCNEHGKVLASATEPMFDLTRPEGRVMAQLTAMFAEIELNGISERNGNAAQYNIRKGKYRGSVAPCGYRAEKDSDGDWRTVPDEKRSSDDVDAMAPVVREIVRRILANERVSHIVWDLNERGVPTQRDRQAQLNGRGVTKRREWSISNLRRILASPTLIGQTVVRDVHVDANGKKTYGEERILIGDDGSPLVKAEPLIPMSDYRALQALLAERGDEQKKTKRAVESTLLLQVLFCGECERPMYRLAGAKGRQPRYRCSSTQTGKYCGSHSVIIATADKVLNDILLALLGNFPWLDRQYVPGEDHTETIIEIDAELEALAESVTRFPAGSTALTRLLDKVDTLSRTREKLAEKPQRAPGYKYVPNGETFREHWSAMPNAERNDYLREKGVRMTHRRMIGVHDEALWTVTFNKVDEMYGELLTTGEGKDLYVAWVDQMSKSTSGRVRIIRPEDVATA